MFKFVILNKEFFIGLVLTLALFWPLFAAPYFKHHDDVQVIRVYEMDQCIKDHQIPCRWVPDLGGLYGYPIFNYYAPLPYYFGELVYLLTHNLIFSAKLMFAVSFLGAYIFMYLFASKLWGKTGGAVSAIFYSYAPYHALDFYIRGAMGEMWALMFFPAIFWAAVKLNERTNLGHLILLGVTFAALITSHNLSLMIFLPISIIWIIMLFFRRTNKLFLWFSFGSAVLALLLSAFYLLPAIIEKDLVHLETTIQGYFSYTEHFKGFKKLFLDATWKYGASIREVPGGEKDGMSYQIGWIHLLAWILAAVAARVLWQKNKWISMVIIFSSTVALLAILMIHPRSEFVWKLIDPLKYLQFPWRFLLLVTFFVSFMSGSIFLLEFKRKKWLWVLLVVMVVGLNFSYFKPERFIQTNDQQLLSGEDWDKQIKRSIFDYLPIYAKEPPAELAKSRYQILTGESTIYDFQEGTTWFNFKARTNSHTIVRLSQYYFPDWKVFIDGKEARMEYKNNSLGLMTILLGKGEHTISAQLFDTPVRSIANTVTITGFIVTTILILVSISRVRRWIKYYKERMS